MIFIYRTMALAFFVLLILSCGKSFLEVRKIQNQAVPSTLEDFRYFMEGQFFNSAPYLLSEVGSDEFLIPESRIAILKSGNSFDLSLYFWEQSLNRDSYEDITEWNIAYSVIYMANIVIEGLNKIKPTPDEQVLYNQTLAIAKFWRAYKYFQLAQSYSDVYQVGKDSPYGLPLRTSADITVAVARSSVHELYQFIERDLKESVPHLIVERDKDYYTRPYKDAGYSLMAKLYLVMDDYDQAGAYADSAINLSNKLIDYNTLDVENPSKKFSQVFPLGDRGRTNIEVIFHNEVISSSKARVGVNALINLAFVDLYEDTDLRKYANFRYHNQANPVLNYKGGFAATNMFVGLSSSENYIIASESFARTNQVDKSLDRLNTLRRHRIRRDDFVPVNERDREKLLRFILDERKRELFGRGRRWEDLRRLNKDPRFAETLTREYDGVRYELPPGDVRYMLPIPIAEIDAARIPQNPR